MNLTPWVQRLLIANVAMYFLPRGSSLYFSLSFIPQFALQRPWTFVTYMFLHAGTLHLLFNMIMLFFFGPRLEQRLGSKDFLWLYFLSGIGGAVLSMVMPGDGRLVSIVGASGAILGVVGGFAYFWPRMKLYIWGILPVEAWVLAMFFVFGSIFFGLSGRGGNVAHFAHLGGIAFAYLFLRFRDARSAARKKRWREGGDVGVGRRPKPRGSREPLERWKAIRRDRLHELNREEVDALFEKITSSGAGSLSDEERSFLDRMADRYGDGAAR